MTTYVYSIRVSKLILSINQFEYLFESLHWEYIQAMARKNNVLLNFHSTIGLVKIFVVPDKEFCVQLYVISIIVLKSDFFPP